MRAEKTEIECFERVFELKLLPKLTEKEKWEKINKQVELWYVKRFGEYRIFSN